MRVDAGDAEDVELGAGRRRLAAFARPRGASFFFFKRDAKLSEGVPEGPDADIEPELGAKLFESESGMLVNGGPDLLLVTAMKWHDVVGGGSGGDFAGGLESSGELPNALGGDGVLSPGVGEVRPVLNVVKDALTEVEREGCRHGGDTFEEPPP